MGGQRSPGRRLPRQTARTGGGREESAKYQGDRHQAPAEAQTPQHHHFQVRHLA